MVFKGSTIEDIYTEIKRRKDWVGRLSFVEFDDDEHGVLTRISREIVQNRYWRSFPDRRKQVRLVFLAFAIEYVRCNKYTDDNIFWQDFEDILGVDKKDQNFIADELLWDAYEEAGIEPKKKENRLIVRSLIDEVRREVPAAVEPH